MWKAVFKIFLLVHSWIIWPIYCKKLFKINRNGSWHVFRLMDFRELTINHESQWEFQLIILEILSHPNQVHCIKKWSMKFSIKDFLSKCDQICRKLRIWSHLLKISLMENFIFYAVGWPRNLQLEFFLLIDLLKELYHVVKISHKYDWLRTNNSLLIWKNIYFTFQWKHCFSKIV